MNTQQYIYTFFAVIISFFFVSVAHGATLSLIPNELHVENGEIFNISIVLDTEDESINAVEAVVSYPTDSLELVGVDTSNSFVNVWMQSPSISKETGTLEFLGGTKDGIGGDSLHVFSMRFKALKDGAPNVSFARASVAAADGQGTEVLSSTSGFISIIETIAEKLEEEIDLEFTPETIGDASITNNEGNELGIGTETIEQERDGEIRNIPERPQVSIPFYPDRSAWYNYSGPFNVFWGLPVNVDAVAIAVNSDPYYLPVEDGAAYCCGSKIEALGEGVWYVHVRFMNDNGWSDTYRHRIAIDSSPPKPFDIDISNLRGVNKRPVITFETADSISGIRDYRVTIDNDDPIITTANRIRLPNQSAGEHTVTVRAYDVAGNFIEQSLNFEVIDSGDEGMWQNTLPIFIIFIIFGIASWFIFRLSRS